MKLPPPAACVSHGVQALLIEEIIELTASGGRCRAHLHPDPWSLVEAMAQAVAVCAGTRRQTAAVAGHREGGLLVAIPQAAWSAALPVVAELLVEHGPRLGEMQEHRVRLANGEAVARLVTASRPVDQSAALPAPPGACCFDPVADVQPCLQQGEPMFLRLPATLPVLAGHFPGAPIIPGAYLLAAIAGAAAATGLPPPTGLARVKFLRPALPDRRLELQLQPTASGLRFAIRDAEGELATGRLLS